MNDKLIGSNLNKSLVERVATIVSVNDWDYGQKLFVRVAGHSYLGFDYNDLSIVLKDVVFQTALFFASKSLYNEIKRQSFEYGRLNEKARLSVKKYYNRYCFRATPFGLFASIGTAGWDETAEYLTINPEKVISLGLSSSAFWKHNRAASKRSQIVYQCNPTIFRSGSEYRYFKPDIHPEQLTVSFCLAAIATIPHLSIVCKSCVNSKSFPALVASLKKHFDNPADILTELISEGFLLEDSGPEQRGAAVTLNKWSESPKKKNLHQVSSISTQALSVIERRFFGSSDITEGKIQPLLECEDFTSGDFYTNASFTSTGGIADKYKRSLNEAIKALSHLHIPEEIPALDEFKRDFNRRFEGQKIPFLKALDPEIGIGYAKLGNDLKDHIGGAIDFNIDKGQKNIRWSPVNELLLNKLVRMQYGDIIDLTDEEINALKEAVNPLPPSFSVSFTPLKSGVVINSAGGCTATALAGRFTVFNEGLLAYARDVVKLERERNPDIIFAEINCITDGKLSDLSNRQVLYEKEIALFIPLPKCKTNQIALADLFVSVIDDRIVLSCKNTKRQIIPRLSSAINYSTHLLPHFRFLGDLQYQGIKSNLSLNLTRFFPGLDFYPRVVYRSAILAAAEWHIGSANLKTVFDSKKPVESLAKLLLRLKVAKIFKLADHDNSITFDCSRAGDLDLLLAEIKGKQKIVLKEYFLSEEVKNDQDQPMAGELITALINRNTVYNKVIRSTEKIATNVQRMFLPGDKWLYYKIYCLAPAADEILSTAVFPLLKKLSDRALIRSWFFIRYNDPGHHLRIRFELNGDVGGEVMAVINKSFSKRLANGNVHQLSLDPYEREIVRYGATSFPKLEAIFCNCSQRVSHFIKKYYSGQTEISHFEMLIFGMDELLQILGLDYGQKEQFLSYTAVAMGPEFGFDKKMSKELNDRYRELKPVIIKCLETPFRHKVLSKFSFLSIQEMLIDLKRELFSTEALHFQQLLRDIIHLYINRLLSTEQRSQEFVGYYMLAKYYRGLSLKINASI